MPKKSAAKSPAPKAVTESGQECPRSTQAVANGSGKDHPRPSKVVADVIQVRGAWQNNLQGINLDLPLGKLCVVTGPSGSGKSSLAFDTIYAEGQRRYVETFSPYTRQFFERMDKPKVDAIHGIPPAIAIEQVNNIRSTRSTVGTITEINDYLKMLFPRLAEGQCPECHRPVKPESPESIQHELLTTYAGQQAMICFGVPVPPGTATEDFFTFVQSQGYLRLWLYGEAVRTDEPEAMKGRKLPAVAMVIQDRLVLEPNQKSRLSEAVEAALRLGKGQVTVLCGQSAENSAQSSVRSAQISEGGGKKGAKSKPNEGKLNTENGTLNTVSFSTDWRCADCDIQLPPPTPGLFSFNSPIGACPTCKGFGRTLGLDLRKAMPDESLSIRGGLVKAFTGSTYRESQDDLEKAARRKGVDLDTAFCDLPEDEQKWVVEGAGTDPEEAWQSGEWYGVRGFFKWLEGRAYKMHVRIFLSRFRAYTTCADCDGGRLKKDAYNFRITGRTIADLWNLPVTDLLPLVQSWHVTPGDNATQMLRDEICGRLSYLDRAGLGYIHLDRLTRTLSGGELQRVNLTTCLGASLVNTLFVLDEPSIGLHPRDIGRLIGVMEGLRDKGNTLLVVEHEESVMRAADHVIEIGPGRGDKGGRLVYDGPLSGLEKMKGSLTADYLTGRKSITVPEKRREVKLGAVAAKAGTKTQKPPKGGTTNAETTASLLIRGARQNNLKNLDVEIPLGVFCCITGVSGSGKSTLVHEVLYRNLQRLRGEVGEDEPGRVRSITGHENLSQVIMVDQSPLARTPRSTPAVYVGAFDTIRTLFAESDDAKAQGVTPGFFSFNSGEGRCERCMGNGFEKIEMQFLSDLYVTCPECEGKRYQPHALKIHLQGRSIHEVLGLTVEEAAEWFAKLDAPSGGGTARADASFLRKAQHVAAQLSVLVEAGLGYLKLGQPLNTLSGGEAQRLKLVGHLIESAGEKDREMKSALLLLDEPTTGLHFDDIALLVKLLQRLVNEGNSLLVIEHNVDVIQCADWVIDLGPDGGAQGGQLVVAGTPEMVAACEESWTGKYLAEKFGEGRAATRVAERAAEYKVKKAADPVAAMPNTISIRGAREHNLKNISIEIPRDEFVVVTGLSGSGKSSLAFDLVFAEGQRRFLDSMSVYARTFVEQMEKPEVDVISGVPPTVAIEQRISRGGGKSTVATVTEVYHFLRLLFAKLGTQYCPKCNVPVQKQSLSAITQTVVERAKKGPLQVLAPLIKARKGFHTDVAEAAAKQGISLMLVDGQFLPTANFERLERFKEHSIDAVVGEVKKGASALELRPILEKALKMGKGTVKLWLPGNTSQVLSTEMSCPKCDLSFEELDPRLFSFNSPHGWCPTCRGFGFKVSARGAIPRRDDISQLEAEMEEERRLSRGADDDEEDNERKLCLDCHGSRLNETARYVRLQDFTVPDLNAQAAQDAAEAVKKLQFSGTEAIIARDILVEIEQRLHFMKEVGLGYLQLNRSADTLSGGEAQRIRLAAQLGSNLRGVLYVLDEPTIGLHPRDNERLLDTLVALRDKGNSLLVVEHDDDTMRRADTIIDLGPGAGRFGGEVISQGNLEHILNDKNSVTGQGLMNPFKHPLRGEWRDLPAAKSKDGWLKILGAHANNLKNIDVQIPVGRLTVITGVSGSGKSTFLHQVLFPGMKNLLSKEKKRKSPNQLWKNITGAESFGFVYEVDQSPIGKTSRSCPATYVGVLDDIRKLFAQVPMARARGYEAGRFSFNTEGGRCEACQGNGNVKVEMNFLPTTRVHCEICNGLRFNSATMEVEYNGKNIGQVLKMSITEAAEFFAHQQRIARPLQLLADTGVGYLQLGQPSPTLSGGEAQRIKLVTELSGGVSRSATEKLRGLKNQKKNLYLIEEPTIGLHMADVGRLIDILHRLVDDGHTVVVIEHHPDIFAEADYIIDIGPEAGADGGEVVATGTPKEVAQHQVSRTAPFLRRILG